METGKILINNEWSFIKTGLDTGLDEALSLSGWKGVEIPHDWLIGDTDNLYESGIGWYKRTFMAECCLIDGGCLSLCFDGVYMDSTLYINGREVGYNKYGYSSFEHDITPYVKVGLNTIVMRVRFEAPNSRWYSGAGIYRNVWFKTSGLVSIPENGVYICTNGQGGKAAIETAVLNRKGETAVGEVIHSIFDCFGNEIAFDRAEFEAPAGMAVHNYQVLFVDNPELWSIENPNMYTLHTAVFIDGEIIDFVETNFGFRTTLFTSDKGFFLNGEHVKLKGVCLHHDLGALGAAVNEAAIRRQLELMKSMGANAIRTTHNMPAREVMDFCDNIGLLVVSEAFDMWETPKNQYDYSRFFEEWAKVDVESWVKRDRNHPSLIMWSIGNEIYDTHVSEHGLEITEMLKELVLEFDPYMNGRVTIGSNFMQWENAQKCADLLKFAGYNYAEGLYDEHHEKHPDWIIYGSETVSTVSSRGIYHFPADVPMLIHEDLQCSSLGNSVVAWGKHYEKAWIADRDRDFCLGQFIWTGIDYIGEPTPYSTKNSYFGVVDTAGLPKDGYYFYQSVWTDSETNPMVHILPYWDWNDGEIIDVIAYTNAPIVELFLNGKSLGKQEIDHEKGSVLHGKWAVAYEKGVLSAKAYDKNGRVIAEDKRESFSDSAKLSMKSDDENLLADGRDLIFIEISALDKDGHIVENARDRVKINVFGPARLVGLDNGDSTDYDSFKGDNKRLFSGKLVAIIQSTFDNGIVTVSAKAKGLEPCKLSFEALEVPVPFGVSVVDAKKQPAVKKNEYTDEIYVRKIELSADRKQLNKENPATVVTAKICPENASFLALDFKLVRDNGVVADNAQAERIDDKSIKITAKGDGKFRLRVMCNNGKPHPEVVSDLSFSAEEMGFALRNPYEFVSASLFDGSNVPVNVIDKGALGGFDGKTSITFEGIDFGIGTRRLILHIGNSGNEAVPVELWLGAPENGRLISKLDFPANGRWDGFEPHEFGLSEKLSGAQTISFVISDRVIFGGFEFIEIVRAFEKTLATENTTLYGDAFKVNGDRIEQIGNNVTVGFGELDFGYFGAEKLTIYGRTPNEKNTIQLRFTPEGGEQQTKVLEFLRSDEYTEQVFDIEAICGRAEISFVFLPGSSFDFGWFRFE